VWGENEIVEGHGRLLAAMDMDDIDTVPVIRLDELTDEQRRAYMLVHNKLTMNTDFDLDILTVELDDIFDIDMSDFGFDLDEEDDEPIEVQEDDVPEKAESRCKLGDLWQLEKHRLICGDSTDVAVIDRLMDGVKADMVFTDPPYGMNLDTDYSKMEGNGRKGKTYSKVIGDNEDFKDDLIKTVFDNFNYCKEIFLWGVDYYFDLIPNFKDGNLIVWDKTLQTNGDAGYNSEFELLWSKNQHKKEVIHFNWFRYFGLSAQDIKTREHPTQKPLQVITPFIEKYSKENDLIVDIYGGSGSTLIACEQLNRKCFMAELDERYVSVIVNRWLNFTGRKDEIFCIRDGQKLTYDEVFSGR
jgi:DNA modification methylase